MRALHAFEQHGEVENLIKLFADDCELQHKPREDLYRGPDGARQFWEGYRGRFASVQSLFTHVTEADSTAVLEWYSDGEVPESHRHLRYSGVSIIEFDDDERVRKFRTYYDSSVFGSERALRVH